MTTSKLTITAYFTPGVPGYGHRLFIPAPPLDAEPSIYDQISAANELLKNLSCWKGADKRWMVDGVEHWGYEFPKGWSGVTEYPGWETPSTTQPSIREQVEAAGITIKPFLVESAERIAAGLPEMKIESCPF